MLTRRVSRLRSPASSGARVLWAVELRNASKLADGAGLVGDGEVVVTADVEREALVRQEDFTPGCDGVIREIEGRELDLAAVFCAENDRAAFGPDRLIERMSPTEAEHSGTVGSRAVVAAREGEGSAPKSSRSVWLVMTRPVATSTR